MSSGQTSGYFDVTANENIPDGSYIMWSGLPAGPSLYVGGYSDGSLHVYRGSNMRGTYTFTYTVVDPDGNRTTGNVTLVLR